MFIPMHCPYLVCRPPGDLYELVLVAAKQQQSN